MWMVPAVWAAAALLRSPLHGNAAKAAAPTRLVANVLLPSPAAPSNTAARFSCITARLPEDEYRAAFDAFDADGNGQVDKSELKSMLERLGLSLAMEKTNALFAAYDRDRNGTIDFDEFEELLYTAGLDPLGMSDDELLSAFNAADADGNGVIDREELQALLERLGQPQAKETTDALFDMYDEDGNGTIDLEEYKKLLRASGFPVMISELLRKDT